MNDDKQVTGKDGGSVNLGRHESQCTICSSPYRQAIEEAFIDWGSTYLIAKQYGVSRDSIYRHMHAFDLFSKRRRNIRMALEKIIERADNMPMSGSQVVSAIQTYVKLNRSGKGTDQDCFSKEIGATPSDSQAGEKQSQVTETKRLQ